MNIGSLYIVKKYFWLLAPTKETAVLCLPQSAWGKCARVHLTNCARTAAWCSEQFNCAVTYFSPETLIVFLEEDGIYKKVLTSDGKIGWTWFSETYNESFEEVNP